MNPLVGFLKPQSPAERLAAQHRDREKLQRERRLKELQEEEAKARLSLLLSAASATASATASAITNSSSSAQAAFTGGLSNSNINSRQGPPEVPSNSKINPQTPSRTEIENLINYLKVWSRSDRGRTVVSKRGHTCARSHL